MINFLDCDASTEVCFRKELNSLVQNQKQDLNLWDLTLKYTHQNRKEAIRWLGVLFQDTHRTQAVTDYAYDKGWISEDDHDWYSSAMNGISFGAAKNYLKQYPPAFRPKSTLLYHFYVSALLSQKLKDSNVSSDELSRLMPVLLNASYKYTKLNSKYKTRPTDPGSLSPEEAHRIAPDIYSSYAGVLFGTEDKRKIPDYETYKKMLTDSPSFTIEQSQ